MIYLAGPIFGCSDGEAVDWRQRATALLGGDVLDPMDRDYRGRETDPETIRQIVEGDKADISRCSGVLANTPWPSFGTAMEIHYAWSLRLPVVAVATGRVSPWLAYHSALVTSSLEDAVAELKRLEVAQ